MKTLNAIGMFSLAMLTHFLVHAQQPDYKFAYYLDENLVSTSKSKAVFIGKGLKAGKLFRLDCFSAIDNALLMSAHFTDSTLDMFQGPFTSFHRNKKLENEGQYNNGYEQGVWLKYDSIGRKTDSSFFDSGRRLIIATYGYDRRGNISQYEFTDSINNKYTYRNYEQGRLQFDAVFSGNNGEMKIYDSAGNVSTKSLSSREKTEPVFPGGHAAYMSYLKSNVDPMTPIDHNAPSGTYTAVVAYTIDKNGDITDIIPETNFGYGIEPAIHAALKRLPRHKPAMFAGMPVVSYRRQPMTFIVPKD